MFTTDKVGHGYLPHYLMSATLYGPHAAVCEIGVANGDGLHMLRTLFPNGEIVGVDRNENAIWPRGTVRVVAEQDDPDLKSVIAHAVPHLTQFDIIIDDASHNNDLTRETWKIMWPMLRPGGQYIIEDWNHCGGLARDLAVELVDTQRQFSPFMFGDVNCVAYTNGLIVMVKKRVAEQ